MGVRKMTVVVSVLAKRRSGTDAERKRISSVIGPYALSGWSFISWVEMQKTNSDEVPVSNPTANSGI
jgi:hypothetical protein